MNFDVNRVLQQQQTPVQRLQQKNEEQETGRIVDHVENDGTHPLKSSSDRDVEDAVKELPNTMAEIANFGDRITQSKMRLGLGEGGFVDQEIEVINYKTGVVEGVEWRTSQQINAEFIAREPMMTDQQLDEFMKMYFVEFDLKTGEVKPRRYPNNKGLKCSVVFPDPPKKTRRHTQHAEPVVEPSAQPPMEEPVVQDPPTESAPVPDRKITYRTEERKVGKRKKLGERQIVQLTDMILDRNSFPCTAVASRYKCDITAVSFQEFDQIQNMVETSKLARETKLWSIIYRHVKNPTIGEFKSFNDFCEHTAWVDRKRFWYALMCTMRTDKDSYTMRCVNRLFKPVDPENPIDISEYEEAFTDIQDISLLPTDPNDITSDHIYTEIEIDSIKYRYVPNINNGVIHWVQAEKMDICGETYDFEFLNRTLLDTDNLPEWVQREIDQINSFSAMNEAIEYHNDGPLMNKRIFPINDSVSMEVGIKSVADVLRNDYKYMLDSEIMDTMRGIAIKEIKNIRGDENYDPSDDEVVTYITEDLPDSTAVPVLSMSVIDKAVVSLDGEEYESDLDTDIINILNNCRPQDLSPFYNGDISNTLIYRYMVSYEPTFSFKGCTCPKCGSKSDVKIEDMQDMVFILSRTLENTQFDIADL